MKFIVPFLIAALIISCTEKKQPGFALPGSQLRFQQAQFDDPNVLAQVGEQVFTKNQILDKSPVLKDLNQQEIDIKIGLAYLHAIELIQSQKVKPVAGQMPPLNVYYQPSQPDIQKILQRFGRQPVANIKVNFRGANGPMIASIGDREIYEKQINNNHFVFQSVQQRRLLEVSQQLSQQASRILINQEAKKEGSNLADYLKAHVFTESLAVSEAELLSYANSISLSEEELQGPLKERIMQALSEKKQLQMIEQYVAKNILTEPMQVSFGPGTARLELDNNFVPIKGYKDGPISVVAFSGPNCLDCYDAFKSIQSALDKYKGYLKFNWILTPETSDSIAILLSQGALCVQAQNIEKSFQFIVNFSRNQAQASESQFYEWGKNHDLNIEALRSCMLNNEQGELLNQHIAYADSLGIVSNPTVWVNGKMLEGVVREAKLIDIIKTQISENGLSKWKAYWRVFKRKLGLG